MITEEALRTPSTIYDEEPLPRIQHCERCGKEMKCDCIPTLDYGDLWVCRKCAAILYRSGQAI